MGNINIAGQLDILAKDKTKIEGVISGLEAKKSQVQLGLSIISPNTRIDVEIKELQLEEQVIKLRKEQRLIELKTQKLLGSLNDEEYTLLVSTVEADSNTEIQLNEDKIKTLREQKQLNDNYKKIKNKKKLLKVNKQILLKEIKQESSLVLNNLTKTLVTEFNPASLAAILSRVLHSHFTSSNSKISALDKLVDTVNTQIDNIQTRNDINKAKISRNNAYQLLTDVLKKLQDIDNILKTIQTIISILLVVVKVVKLALNFVPSLGGQALLQQKLDKIQQILLALLMIVSTAKSIFDYLVSLVSIIRDRLKQIGDLLDQLIANPDLSVSDVSLLTNSDYGKLGMLNTTYKGFAFAVKEENDSNHVVQGFKRRYAVAINLKGVEILKSEPSFTLDPATLVGELELYIDQRNLIP